jgi:hypothetical protein
LAVNGIKTDLWLTADKEVLPFTVKKPELQWEALEEAKKICFVLTLISKWASLTLYY